MIKGLKQDNKALKEYYYENYNPMEHLVQINYPRGAGSPGESKIADYLLKTLTKYGYNPKLEEFYFSHENLSFMSFIPVIILLIWISSFISNILLFSYNELLSMVILFFLILLIALFIWFGKINQYFIKNSRNKLLKLNKKIEEDKTTENITKKIKKSRNVIASVGPEEASKHILFTAHFDSISSNLSAKSMKILGLISIIGFFLLNIFYFLNLLTMNFFQINFINAFTIIFIVGIVVVFICLLILLISRYFRGNDSHGVIDDGTGISVLLEVAKFLKDQKINDLHVTFGFFGSEELGLYGSGYHYAHSIYNKDKISVISVDMIGEKAPISFINSIFPLRKQYFQKDFNTNIEHIGKEFNIKVKGSNFPYSGSDFAHWFMDGYKSNWLINPSTYIHSKYDNISNVDPQLVQDTLILIVQYLKNFLPE